MLTKISAAALATAALLVAALVPLRANGQSAQPVTFTKDVAPILYERCVGCHRPGEIAPMSLLTYEQARPWAKSIRKVVADRVMPPWHGDAPAGVFANDRRLSSAQIDTILAWVDQGAQQGDPNDLPPAPAAPTDGWHIGTPDIVYEMPEEFSVSSEGTVDYQHFTIPTTFTEDKWVVAAEIKPGNRSVVHHVIVFVDDGNVLSRAPAFRITSKPTSNYVPPPRRDTDNERRLGAFLVGTAPGAEHVVYAPGSAKRIKAGSTLTFQMHYTTNGQPAKDRTRVALKFASAPPTAELRTVPVWNPRFIIPANAANYRVDSSAEFSEDVTIWSFFPHMHYRGKSFEYRLVKPDGESSLVLSVPKYDFNWQGEYTLTEPLRAPKGSRLECVAYFDNSRGNKANPNPGEDVRWGEQTWEEMMIGWITFSVNAPVKTTAAGR